MPPAADSETISQVEAVTGPGQVPSQPGNGAGSTINAGTAALGGVAVGFIAGALAGAIGVLVLRRYSR